jgi:hypothetical protein
LGTFNTGGKFTISAVETGGKFRKNVIAVKLPPAVHLELRIYSQFFEKIAMTLANVIIGGRGKMVYKEPETKNLVALPL